MSEEVEVEIEDMKSITEYLEWALGMINTSFKEHGTIGFAEAIVYGSGRAKLKEIKSKYGI